MKTRKGEKRGHVKNFFKKGVIWSLVISLLFGTVIMTATTVAEEEEIIDLDPTATKINDAAEKQVKAAAFKKCVEGMDRSPNIYVDKDDIFDQGNDTDVYVGAWYESLINKSDIDGKMECDDGDSKVLTLFANMLGKQDIDILCNGELPGLVGVVIEGETFDKGKSVYGFDTGLNCRNEKEYRYNNITNFSATTEGGSSYSSGEEYVKALYDEWRKNQDNDYIVSWDNLNDYTATGYRMLMNDAETKTKGACNIQPVNDDVVIDNIIEISYVGIGSEYGDKTGTILKKRMKYSSTANQQYSISGVARTCKGFEGGISDQAGKYRRTLANAYKSECKKVVGDKWEFVKQKAEAVLSTEFKKVSIGGDEYQNYECSYEGTQNGQQSCKMKSYSAEEKNEAISVITQYNNYAGNGFTNINFDYWYTYDNDYAFTCKTPPGYILNEKPYEEPDNGESVGADSCQSNAGALGWVICNVLELAGSAAESAYESFLKPQLEVNPVLIGATGNESTASAWSKFQGFANIVFAIVFLIIIFSQLTGYGIDNYGIKKILPKLIVTVILVNLSFVICQVAVDLSNILGNSLQNLFSSFKVDATLTETFEGTTDTFQISAGTQTLLWAVLVGVLVGGGIAIWRNPALLISLLISVLGVLIAGFFVFILLAARQAAIVVLIVLSPLAFVCYALPNTKKLFDKWLKLMQSLLLVYPICGLLIGGGDFASRLLLSAGLGTSFAAGLTAMLVGIVPIFFIPTVLKNSMSALGGLGAKISGLGNKVSGGAKSTLRNTRAYKNAQERGKARGDRKFAQARAGVHLDKETGKFVNSKNPLARLRRRTAGSWIGRHLGTDAAMGEQQAKLRSMEEKQQQNAMTAEVGVAPLVNASNLRQKMQNAINEAVAENEVPVVPVDVELAIQRRKSTNEAQELKNYKDQFAEYSKAQLEEEAGRAGDWLSKDGGTQRMQALLSAMESQGMQKSMAGVLEKHGDVIGNNAKIMQTLAGSKDKVFKAYGKAGAGQSYKQFMSGTGNGKSLAEYVKEKDVDFLDGLDDKALAQIRNYQTSDNNIMSGSMLAQAAAKINSQDATDEIDKMIRSKIESGEKVEFSAAQYANLNNSTQEMLDSLHRSGNSSVGDNLIRISNDMINAPEQYAKLNFNEKDANGNGVNGSGTYLNEARARAGLGTMQDAIQSLHVPHSS